MEETFGERLKRAWNVFLNKEEPIMDDLGSSSFYRPDRIRLNYKSEHSMVAAIQNRIALDVASIDIRHVQLDDKGRFDHFINSGLDHCLTIEANTDQTGRSFMQDAVLSMLDEGCVAVVPVETKGSPLESKSYKILALRTGRVITWHPDWVELEVFDARVGHKEHVNVPKYMVALIENPFYAVVNSPNSTMQRLSKKLAMLDAVDSRNSSGKLDLIVKLPYPIRGRIRKDQAQARHRELESQLEGSKYGIGYIDAAEQVIQLNRPVENNLMSQIEYLTNMLFSQLGMTQSILDGTADEKVMLNYYNRMIEPIISAFSDEFTRKFLTQTARSQGQSIEFFRDPFKLVPINDLAELSDKMTRNEIMTSNEIRQVIGMQPSNDPKADELRNSNINQKNEEKQNNEDDNFEERSEEYMEDINNNRYDLEDSEN